MASSLLGRLRQFDAYPKTLEDFRIKTYGGAAITIISGTLILILFLSELNYYLTTEVRPELFVDTSRGERLLINVDVTFLAMPCACEFKVMLASVVCVSSSKKCKYSIC
jgi:hypothetical protein